MPTAQENAASEGISLLRDGGFERWGGYGGYGGGAGRSTGTAGTAGNAQRTATSESVPLKTTKAGAVDDDDEETFFERINNSDAMVRFNAALDRIYQNYFVAVAFDVVGCLMFLFDIYTDALVVQALSQTEHKDWMITTLVLILYHYALMAVLITAYYRRISTKLNVLGLEEGDSAVGGAAVLGGRKRYRWLLMLPLAIPGVVVLDICMLFTSLLPLMFPRMFANFSSFLSNYNFSRFFIEFVFESIPQTILQTYIYHQLAKSHLAGSGQQRTVALSLVISSLNCLKYGYKLWKAADDAGLTLLEYFKYLLLLKGNYECSPSSMITVINECCAMKRAAALERADTRSATAAAAAATGAGAGSGVGRTGGLGAGGGSDLALDMLAGSAAAGAAGAGGGGGGGAGGGGAVFIMNGFHLHRNKSQYGPAQQAYILLNAFDRMEGCSNVTRWVVSGCPLASMNRILEKGIKAFRNLNTLEVNECALRGDTWKVVTRAIKRHKFLDKVKLIQTGILTKYRNAKRLKVVTGLFKHSLRLRTVALCLHWWDEQYLQDAVELYLLDHPTLESLAIELPPGAPFAARDVASDPHAAASATGGGGGGGGAAGAHMNGGGGTGFYHHTRLAPPLTRQGATGLWGHMAAGARRWSYTAAGTAGGKGWAGAVMPGSRSAGGAPVGGGAAGRARFGTVGAASAGGGAATGFLSPFAVDTAAATAAAGGSEGGGGVGGAIAALPGTLLGWVQQGSGALIGLASYVSDTTISTLQGLTSAVIGGPAGWGDDPEAGGGAAAAAGGGGGAAVGAAGGFAASAGVASPRYCWMLASVLAAAPALKSLYIHNHALPEAAQGVGALAAALLGNSRLTSLSLRGSTVGDPGAAALARVLAASGITGGGGGAGAGGAAGMGGGNTTLQSLNLRKCQLHDEGVIAVFGCLSDNQTLRTLDLSHNRVQGARVGRVLERALRLNSGLTELRLEGWRDTFDDPQVVSALASALAVNSGLRTLSLAGCSMSNSGAITLAAALAVNSSLTSLNLCVSCADGGPGGGAGTGGGGGGGAGAAGGAAAVGSGIGDHGVAALAAAMARNSTLRELHLGGAAVGELGGAALGDCLAGGANDSLQLLDLSCEGGGGGGGAEALLEALGGGGGAVQVEVAECSLPAEGLCGAAAVGGGPGGAGGGQVAGVCDAAAVSIFTALQSNKGLRVLRLRGAHGLSIRAVRAAAEALRRNCSLRELDLSGATFLAGDPDLLHLATSVSVGGVGGGISGGGGYGSAAATPSHRHQHQHQHHGGSLTRLSGTGHHHRSNSHSHPSGGGGGGGGGRGLLPPLLRPSSLRSIGSSKSLQSLASLVRGQQPATPRTPHNGSAFEDSAAAAAAASDIGGGSLSLAATATTPRRLSSNGLTSMQSVGGVAGGDDGDGGGGGGYGGLSAEALEMVGALWSAFAGGLAANTALRVLRLAYCGLGVVGAAALAPALMQNSTLQELDLTGLSAATARQQLGAVIACAAANLAAAAAVNTASASNVGALAHGGGGGGGGHGWHGLGLGRGMHFGGGAGGGSGLGTPRAAAAASASHASGLGAGGACALVSIKATNESYEVVDLLGADKVTSRAAEEAAAAAEEAMRAPGRWGRRGSGGGSGHGASGQGDYIGGALLSRRGSGGASRSSSLGKLTDSAGGAGSSGGGLGPGGGGRWWSRLLRR
ncbi:hypothetical protein HYH02_008808 [Chlamydomonas schloesseri]|uniref:Uncharacterized protein n=1 Tax=Chlamydomonas schloesseri TaxID=2026947 RepID=A0A836B2D1_9CHLO|nr:hypothetical protein HYH02_008808 [Chlamydomonas schloesseri]|eukprot:KAG2445343.1 hypothetical protein HYH02_008808 [Chlamydomonas schloesseri]